MSALPNILLDDEHAFDDLLTVPKKRKTAGLTPLPSSRVSKADLEARLKEEMADIDCNELLMIWVREYPGHFRSRGIRFSDKSDSWPTGPEQLAQIKRETRDGRFNSIEITADARWWSVRLSALAARGFIKKTKNGYFSVNVSAEANRLAGLRYRERLEDLRSRVPDLAREIEDFMALYEPFKGRVMKGYFLNGSVDGLAPVTASRRLVNHSHIISVKMAQVFGFPNLKGAGNILLEEVSVNQARADGLVFSRVEKDKVRYNVLRPNEVSFHIQKLHNKEIKSPRQLRDVHLAAVKLSNRLEDYVAAVSQSPEAELYRVMNGLGESTEIVSLSEQSQETYEIMF